jgi:hypothetical protein
MPWVCSSTFYRLSLPPLAVGAGAPSSHAADVGASKQREEAAKRAAAEAEALRLREEAARKAAADAEAAKKAAEAEAAAKKVGAVSLWVC